MRSTAWYGTLGAFVLAAAALAGTVGAPRPDPGPGTHSGTATGTATASERKTAGLPLPLRDAREAVGATLAARAAAEAGVDWHACPASEELPTWAECGEVAVPVDYAHPRGEKTVLTVSRKRATGPEARRQGPLLHNPGGPGADGMDFPLYPTLRGGVWKRLNSAYDFVGYAPRGVGRPDPLLCREPGPAGEADGPARPAPAPGAAYKRRLRAGAAEFAEDCARRNGGRLAHFTTPDNARDLDVLRAALHRDRLSYIGTSYGSYLGSVYATLFPGRVRRLVLDSVVDPRPRRIWYGDALAQSRAFQRRWRDFTSWAARRDSVYGLGRSPRSVQRHFDRARAAAAHGRFTASAGGDGARRLLLRSYQAAGYREESWPRLARALARFAEGDPRALARMTAPDGRTAAERENSDSVYSAVQCSEGHWPRDWRRWERDHEAVGGSAPYQTWETVRADLPCAYWRDQRTRPVDVRAEPGALPPVLLLASTRDAATPYRGAVETWKRLPGSSLVTERGTGTHGVAGGNRCADAHLAAYLLRGEVPGRAAECSARPLPGTGDGA